MSKKQLSGYQKRLKAKARAESRGLSVPLVPLAPGALDSLTAVSREQQRAYAAFLGGKLKSEDYQTAVRGLASMSVTLAARIAERQLEADETLARAVAAYSQGQAVDLPSISIIDQRPTLTSPDRSPMDVTE